MTKKRDSLRVRRPRNTPIENKTVLIRGLPAHAMKAGEAYLKNKKKTHEQDQSALFSRAGTGPEPGY
jgi:hypothetical protein